MHKSTHERATEIIAEVLELSYDEAIKKIELECGDDKDLKSTVLDLYKEINEEDERIEEKKKSKDWSGYSRIGSSIKKTRELGKIPRFLFEKKRNRLVTMLFVFLVLATVGIVIRNGFKSRILQSEQEEFLALLKTQSNALTQWIDREINITDALASSKVVVPLASKLDSLIEARHDYSLLKNDDLLEPIYAELNRIRNNLNLEALSIVDKKDPVYLILTEEAKDGVDNIFDEVRIGKKMYDYYLEMKSGNSIYVPPLHDTERFVELPENLNVGTYTTFSSPIKKNGEIVGFLFNEFNVENRFSEILGVATHGKTTELYAFDRNGKMASRSRFQNDLQRTSLLDYDTTKSSVFNIELKDPGHDITKYENPKIDKINQDFTVIATAALDRTDTVLEGTIMEPYRDYRGIEVVGAWRWLPEYGFGIIAEENVEDAFMSIYYFDTALGLFYFILAILIVFIYNLNTRFVLLDKKIEDLETMGQYHILQKIGEGGFGVVFKAEHTLLKTPVAIKQLKKEFIGTDMLDRFEKEVKVTASLSHPNTVRVFDYGKTENDQFYYVMEFLNGLSLEQILSNDETMPVGRMLYILLQTCYSLQEAHTHGLIHRDIKPMNIMVCNQGGAFDHVKVLDFGLVKNLDTSASQQTQMNRIGGTPMFMAPERIRDPFNTDQKVDIYSIGAVGLYALSGSYVVELMSTNMMSGMDTLEGDIKNMLVKRDDVSEGLEKLLLDCIHFDPGRRPSDINQIISQLEKLRKWHPWTREDAINWWKSYDVYN